MSSLFEGGCQWDSRRRDAGEPQIEISMSRETVQIIGVAILHPRGLRPRGPRSPVGEGHREHQEPEALHGADHQWPPVHVNAHVV
jgi:hypothetical protein